MLGDTAVAVHPEDTRYSDLVGKSIDLPLAGRSIPIIADDYVDPEFGSGCVKITPAHDFNDYEMGLRHDLAMINILDVDAALNNSVPEAYRGLDRFVAREQIVKDLDSLQLLEKVEPHTLKVPRGDRSGAVIEPYLTNQWYIATEKLAAPAIAAVESGEVEFVPKNWENTYFAWMRNIQDWCISRQLWWGHRIPAWYDNEGRVYVGHDEAEVREKHRLPDAALNQDEDVLDTWFSSALWTFGTLGWPEDTVELKTFHPTSVLVTGFDIIFFWVARMIMLTLHFRGEVPFRQVYMTGLVRDADGQKMSKSKGNVLDPIDLIDGIDLDSLIAKRTSGLMQPQLEKQVAKNTRRQFPDGIQAYGTDALRFTYCSLASTGRDINFDLGRIEGYRNFCNKIWNAARYVLMNTEEHDCASGDADTDFTLGLPERWIISRLQETEAEVIKQFAAYRFDLASQAIYEFIWNEYCDWYLELSKPTLWAEDTPLDRQRGTRRTLVRVLEASLRMAHPLLPFVTEEIWQRVAPLANKSGDSIMLQSFPQPQTQLIDSQANEDIEWLKQMIVAVRNIRAEFNIAPGKQLTVYLKHADDVVVERMRQCEALLLKLAKLDAVCYQQADEEAPLSATQLVQDVEVLIPIGELIDKDVEIVRLNKELGKLTVEQQRLQNKLANAKFVDRAPPDVVEKEREKLSAIIDALAKLESQLETIKSI